MTVRTCSGAGAGHFSGGFRVRKVERGPQSFGSRAPCLMQDRTQTNELHSTSKQNIAKSEPARAVSCFNLQGVPVVVGELGPVASRSCGVTCDHPGRIRDSYRVRAAVRHGLFPRRSSRRRRRIQRHAASAPEVLSRRWRPVSRRCSLHCRAGALARNGGRVCLGGGRGT